MLPCHPTPTEEDCQSIHQAIEDFMQTGADGCETMPSEIA